jgi:hypothetical protein
MRMKMSSGAKIALGLGALVVLYLVMKNSQGTTAAAPSGSNLVLPDIQPISSAGIVAIDVQPPLIPMNLSTN